LVTLLLLTAGLAVFLWAGTLFLQGYIYTEPAGELYWRAPAAAGALGLFLGLWCILNYNSPDRYGTLFDFNPSVSKSFSEFKSRRKGSQEKTVFTKKGLDFRSPRGEKWAPTGGGPIVESVYVPLDDGKEVEFRADVNEKGNFKKETPTSPVRYLEVDGSRAITQDQLDRGEWSASSTGLFFVNLLINLFHLGLWFVCLWLLLRFQWLHALGLGLILWLVMTLVANPLLLTPASNAGREAEKEARATARAPDQCVPQTRSLTRAAASLGCREA
jgi:hypothetical protein